MSLFEEINTGEGDFNEISSPLTNENTAFEEVSPFNQISRSVWNDISNDSPFSNVKDTCGDFDKKFYGLSLGQGINWDRLVKFLKQRKLSDQLFNYDEFKGPVHVTFSASGNYSISKTESNTPIPFTYTTSHLDGEREQKGLLNGKLNKRVCYLSHDYGHIVRIDAEDEEIKATLQFYYENTAKYRVPVRDTPKPNDFYINDKYVAVALNTSNLRDFVHAILLIEGDRAFNKIKNKIITQYVKALKKAKDSAAINFLYENAPEFVLDALSDHLTFETFVQHIDLLIKHDTEGIFSGYIDSSSAMVNLFKGIGNIKQLYKLLRDNPTFVKTIYYNLDGDSEVEINVNGQAQKVTKKNRVIFSQLMLVLCKLNQYEGIEEQETSYHYYLGQNYRIDSNMNPENDADESNPEQAKKYWLQQWSGRTVMKDKVVDHDVDLPRASRKVQVPTIQFYPDDKGHYFYPFEPITLSLIDDKDDGTVPAIYIKALADSAERESIHEAIRIGADFLAIIIGVATLGSASPLLLALSIADIGLASSDLMVIASQDELMKTKEGQEFLANWNKFMAISGVAVASPLVINSASKALISGARLLSKVSVQSTRNFIMSVMIKAMLELNILRFSKNTIKILPTNEVRKLFAGGSLLSNSLSKLEQVGVRFVSGERIIDGKPQKLYAAIYKDVVLAEGTQAEIRRVLSEIPSKDAQALIRYLDDYAAQWSRKFKFKQAYEKGFLYYEIRRLSLDTIRKLYGRAGIKLEYQVESLVQQIVKETKASFPRNGKSTLSSRAKRILDDKQLVAGMVHQDYPDIIKLKTNFPKKSLDEFILDNKLSRTNSSINDIKKIYSHLKKQGYLKYDMHPRVEELIQWHMEELVKGIEHSKDYRWGRTGGFPGTHAEILAMNDLLWELEKINKNILNNDIFSKLIGYNIRLRDIAPMIRCGDCQLLTHQIPFLEKIIKNIL